MAQSQTPATDVLNVRNLSSELETVTDWYQLGFKLGLPTHELRKIQFDYQGSGQRMLQMLDLWLRRTPRAAWGDVVSALRQIGENRVAESICHKYIRGKIPTIQEDSGAMGFAQRSRRTIEGKFAILLMNTCRKLRGRPINFVDLHTFLVSYFPRECIPKSSDINEIFDAISHHKLWDYWNYYPLEEIVKAVDAANDSDISSLIKAYKRDLESYKVTTKLIDLIPAADSDSDSILDTSSGEEQVEQPARHNQRYYKSLSHKLKTKFTHHTLKYIDNLWNECADLYNLPPHVVLLDHIRKGCVSIVWLVPSHLAPQILSAAPHSGDFYHKHEITRVELGGKCIYQEEEKIKAVALPVQQVAGSMKRLELHSKRKMSASVFGITGKIRTPCSYCAQVFYTWKKMHDWRFYFVITPDFKLMNTAVREHYGTFSIRHAILPVGFVGSQITLDIPEDGLVTGEGWRIAPSFHPTISKKDADQFVPGQWIPECQLVVQWEREDQRLVRLRHKVDLIGAKPPYNYFHLTLDSTSKGQHSKYPAGLDSEPELPDLMNEVAVKIPSKWRVMGLQLGVDWSVLKRIATTSPGDTNHCYINVFTQWKNQNSTIHPYTWSTIAQALERPAVGEKRLADEIKEKLGLQ